MEGRKTTVRVGRATQKPDRILADDAYWNVPFLDRYLSRCGQIALHEPLKAYAMSAPIVDLADTRITVRGRPGAYKSAVERRSYRVRARAVRASCARRIGELDEAAKLYDDAFELAAKPIDRDTKADLHTRYGWLLMSRSDEKALKEAEDALELKPCAVILAKALVLKGAAVFKFETQRGGIEHFARAVALSKNERTTKQGRRVFCSALHGLAKVLSESSPNRDAQAQAYILLEEVKSYLAGRPKSFAKMQVYWQMGRIAFNLGYNRHGPRLLKRARTGLLELGEIFEYALISLDLAGFYLQSWDIAEYDALVADTHAVLSEYGNPKLLEAISTWSRDVRVPPKEIGECRKAVEALKSGEPSTSNSPCRSS